MTVRPVPLKKLNRLAIRKDFFREPVAITDIQTGQTVDPAAIANYWTLVAENADPATGEWKQGSWETVSDGSHLARVMLGPPDGDFILVRGTTSDLYMRLDDAPEAPVYGPWRLTAT